MLGSNASALQTPDANASCGSNALYGTDVTNVLTEDSNSPSIDIFPVRYAHEVKAISSGDVR